MIRLDNINCQTLVESQYHELEKNSLPLKKTIKNHTSCHD